MRSQSGTHTFSNQCRLTCFSRNPEGKADLEDLRKALHDPTNGVDYVLRRMNSLLKPLGADSNKSLIALQSEMYTAGLASEDMSKTIPWYLRLMDEYLARQFSFQTAGLALQLLTADKGLVSRAFPCSSNQAH